MSLQLQNNIILGDCFEKMKDIPDNSIDMILSDMPYGITQNKWDEEINLYSLWSEFNRITHDVSVVVLTASQPFSSKLVMSNLTQFKHEWIWEKDGGSNFANVKREPMKEHEHIIVFSKKCWTYNPIKEERIGNRKGKITKSVFKTNTTNYNKFNKIIKSTIPEFRVPRSIQRFTRERGLHPNQKPVKLFEYLIKTYSDEGDLILDPFAGSGTTAIACLNTNNNFICIEKDEKYFQTMNDRITEKTRGNFE